MVAWIIDRRLNPQGKSLVNSQRFVDKAKSFIKESIDESVRTGNIETMGSDGKNTITISSNSLKQPTFHFERKFADFDFVLPGNKDTSEPVGYVEKDLIDKPQGGKGKGNQGSPDGDGVDEFSFHISPEEWADILFQDMELPDLEEKNISEVEQVAWKKAGFKTSGSPANISLRKTFGNSFGRRTALNRPKTEQIEELEEKFFDLNTPPEEKEAIRLQLEQMKRKLKAIPYLDTVDVRYYNLDPVPKPIYNAAMYCLMDCSGSMTEHMKDLAKRFYILLYRFLKTKYGTVDVVFIRHTHEAEIVDEHTFFYDPDTGGTIVSTALKVLIEDMDEKHPPADWNIYIAQTSDGDNMQSDNALTRNLLEENIFPNVKYYAYLEVGRDMNAVDADYLPKGYKRSESDLWNLYTKFVDGVKNFVMKKANNRSDIYPVFSELFAKRN